MYASGGRDSYAHDKLSEHDRTIRDLVKRVAELEAALKARDEAADTVVDLAGRAG